MDIDNGAPVLPTHLCKRPFAKDPGVIDKNVEPAEFTDCGINHRLYIIRIADIAIVGQRPPAFSAYFCRHKLRHVSACLRPVPFACDRQIIHDHAGTLPGKSQRICAAQTTPGTRNERHLAFEQTRQIYTPSQI